MISKYGIFSFIIIFKPGNFGCFIKRLDSEAYEKYFKLYLL